MTEGPLPSHGRVASYPLPNSPEDQARRTQLLTTEHWSLLATRSMSWNEAFSRTGTFLSTLSAGTVSLALAGPAMAFGTAFTLFALVILAVILFLGIATYVRLVQVNNEDLYWVYGMNRLRGAYARMVPGIEHEFITGHTVDAAGFARTFGAVNVTTEVSMLHAFVTTPAVVGVIASVVFGVIVGLVAAQLGTTELVAVGGGMAGTAIGIALMLRYGVREYRKFVARMTTINDERSGQES
ncbi:MAG TPA: hypothetical protein VHR16_06700 [Candidatus Limnocylindrales bacterium]|jgi:hypothetical protein|nr:hypothetical protein [Candidatus Limnocylindrales bacterium]